MNDAQSMCGPVELGGGEDQRGHGTWATLCVHPRPAASCAWAGATVAFTDGSERRSPNWG